MGFQKGKKRAIDKHPLDHLTPQQRWEEAIQILGRMYGDCVRDRKSPKQPQPSNPEPRRRKPKPIHLHVVYEDFDGRVWHEHDSVYPEPETNSAARPKAGL